jgi:hypothetical protein
MILRHPVYAGAYVFGRTTQRTRVVDGRARRTTGHSKPLTAWNVLLRDHHLGYISWEVRREPEADLRERPYTAADRAEVSRGGRALLTGLGALWPLRPDDAGFYGSQSSHAHRYFCRGDDSHVGGWLCIGVGGVRVDRAVAAQIVEAVSEHAVEAALQAANQSEKATADIRQGAVPGTRGSTLRSDTGRSPL